ncbi:hypothetical protein C8R48DRAFT_668617 [Suillus tomentosus]|nr:hypothetical protein C8R48DRAFT_668617 [Suillus tomentosus]
MENIRNMAISAGDMLESMKIESEYAPTNQMDMEWMDGGRHHQCLRAPVKTGNHDHDLSELYNVTDTISSMTIEDTDDLEANLLMELARARREIFRAEKSLADCMVREHEVLAHSLKFESSISKRKLDKADVGLGCHKVSQGATRFYKVPQDTTGPTNFTDT